MCRSKKAPKTWLLCQQYLRLWYNTLNCKISHFHSAHPYTGPKAITKFVLSFPYLKRFLSYVQRHILSLAFPRLSTCHVSRKTYQTTRLWLGPVRGLIEYSNEQQQQQQHASTTIIDLIASHRSQPVQWVDISTLSQFGFSSGSNEAAFNISRKCNRRIEMQEMTDQNVFLYRSLTNSGNISFPKNQ